MVALEQLGLQDSIQIGSYVVVAPGTGTITAALAGVSTNAYNNWVVLYLAAGTYIDAVDLTGKPWVMILGEYSAVGAWGVQIYDESQTNDTVLQSGSKNILANLRITHYTKSGETYKYACHADGSTISGVDFGWLYAFNCWFEASAQTVGESKAALGSRVYANQIQCFESCKFTSSGLYAIYANNATSAQSAIGEYWFRNCTSSNAGTASTAYGFLFSNGGTGKQDRIQFSNCAWVGGASATADTKIENGGSGAWEAYLLADPSCSLGTVSIGSTNRLTTSLVSPRLPKALNRTFYGGSWYSGPSGAAILSTGYVWGSRMYMGIPGASNVPYILGNGQGYDFVDGGGNTRMTIQSNGVVTISAGSYFDLAAGVQFTIRGPLVTTIQTVADAGTISGTGGYYIKLTGATATMPPSGSTQTGQDFTVKNVSGGAHTLSANAGQSIIDLSGASVASIALASGAACRLIFIGSNTWHQVS